MGRDNNDNNNMVIKLDGDGGASENVTYVRHGIQLQLLSVLCTRTVVWMYVLGLGRDGGWTEDWCCAERVLCVECCVCVEADILN